MTDNSTIKLVKFQYNEVAELFTGSTIVEIDDFEDKVLNCFLVQGGKILLEMEKKTIILDNEAEVKVHHT